MLVTSRTEQLRSALSHLESAHKGLKDLKEHLEAAGQTDAAREVDGILAKLGVGAAQKN